MVDNCRVIESSYHQHRRRHRRRRRCHPTTFWHIKGAIKDERRKRCGAREVIEHLDLPHTFYGNCEIENLRDRRKRG